MDCFLDHTLGKHLENVTQVPGKDAMTLNVCGFKAMEPSCGCILDVTVKECADARLWQLSYLNPLTFQHDNMKEHKYKNNKLYQ